MPVRSTAKLLTTGDVRFAAADVRHLRAAPRPPRSDGGHLATIDHAEFEAAFGHHPAGHDVLRLLAACGVEIARRDGRIVEKTGLIAIAGALKQIDAGAIPRGSRILCCLTSGAGATDGGAVPEIRVRDLSVLERESRDRWFGRLDA
jgi:hypothetical protein